MTDEAPPPQRGNELASQSGLRASHVDRDRVVELLRVAAGDGRLTAEELDERLEAALTANTYGELAALSADLPFMPGAPVPEPKDVARIECHGSSVKRDGRWLVPQRMEVRVTGGSVTTRRPAATRTSTGRGPAAGGVARLGYGPDGKRIRRKARGQTRTEVRDKLRGLHSDIEAGIRKPPSLDVPGAVPTPGDAVTLEVTLRDRPACR